MFAVIPSNCKPSKSVSTDQTRPVLAHAELRETDDGWELVTCDSYQLARVKLTVKDDPAYQDNEPLTPGAISLDALKACEKAGAFRANGTVTPCHPSTGAPTGPAFPRTDPGQFPKWDSLIPDTFGDEFEIGLDAELLYKLAQSLGAKKRGKSTVRIKFQMDDLKRPNPLKPFIVHAMGNPDANGIMMPVRISS